MDTLVRSALALRRTARRITGILVAGAFSAAWIADLVLQIEPKWRYPAVVLYVLLVTSRIRAKLRRRPNDDFRSLIDCELFMLLSTAALAITVRADGNLDGPTYPVVYAYLVLASVLAQPAATVATVGFVVATEAAARFIAFGEADLWSMSAHGAFHAVFSIVGVVLLRAEVARIRSHSRTRVEAEIERMHDAARSYRLLGATTTNAQPIQRDAPAEDDLGRLVRSSVEEIHQAVLFALDLLRSSLNLHSAMLLWLTDTCTHLRISELSTDSDEVSEGPFLAGDGVFGAVVIDQKVVRLSGLKASYRLPYYSGACPVRVVAAVPVVEQNHLRGLLVVDRRENVAITDSELELLIAATRYVLRAIQNERVFVQLERAKVEQGKLYRAARALAAALTERDVVEASVRSAREIAAFDFAAVTVYDEAKRMHEIRAVSGDGVDKLVGARFRPNTGIVSMVVQNHHPLPYRGDFDQTRQVIFTSRIAPPPMPSILALPLVVHDRPLGTLVLGAKRKAAFGDAVRPTLEVLASHVAVSLANARMLKRLEELATSDGLTGLYNKRALLEMVDAKLAAAKRFARKMSVLVVDIDHFKKVNDTYGHDIGDVVLRGLGGILRKTKRTTDIVARFGGEEFVILCEETDREGAMLLAERVREELGRTSFQTPKGELSVTCSIGISTFPDAGQEWENIFKAADDALYVSKRSGRNRCTCWSPQRKSTTRAA